MERTQDRPEALQLGAVAMRTETTHWRSPTPPLDVLHGGADVDLYWNDEIASRFSGPIPGPLWRRLLRRGWRRAPPPLGRRSGTEASKATGWAWPSCG